MKSIESLARRFANSFSRPDVYFPSCLAVSGILFFSDLLFAPNNLYFRDILNFHYPLRKVLMETLARWELPLWNPHVYLGQPMLANPNYMALYPTTLFHLFVPFDYAFKLHFVVHPVLGGLGLYFFSRRLGVVPFGAFGGALVYQFSGPVLSFLNLYNLVPAVALLPWTLWAIVRALKDDWRRYGLVLGLLLALQIICFEPVLFQCTIVFSAAIALLHVREAPEWGRALWEALRVALLGMVLGIGLASVQVLPTLELLNHSARSGGYSYAAAADWSMHRLELLNVVVPNLLGDPYTLDGRSYWGEALHRGREGYLVSFFLGGGALLLSILAMLSERKRLAAALYALAAVGVVLALGEHLPIHGWLYRIVPGFSLGRYPSKYFLLTTVSVSILVGLGLEALTSVNIQSRKIRMRWLAALSAVIGLSIACWILLQTHAESVVSWLRAQTDPLLIQTKDFGAILENLSRSVGAASVFWTLLCVLVVVLWTRRYESICKMLLLIVLGAELVAFNLRLVPLLPEREMNLVPDVDLYIRDALRGERYRVVPLDSPRSLSAVIQAPNRSKAWDSLFLRLAGQPMNGITNGLDYSVFFSVDDLNTRESNDILSQLLRTSAESGLLLLGRTNSRFMLTVGSIENPKARLRTSFATNSNLRLNVYELENALPRVYFAAGVESVRSSEEALEKISNPDFDARRSIVLQGGNPTDARGPGKPGEVRLLDYSSTRIGCEVDAGEPGFVVLLDSYYPGWTAIVDGKSAEIVKANFAFRAVRVSAGKHRIEFVYSPRSFYLGLLILGGQTTIIIAIKLIKADLGARKRA